MSWCLHREGTEFEARQKTTPWPQLELNNGLEGSRPPTGPSENPQPDHIQGSAQRFHFSSLAQLIKVYTSWDTELCVYNQQQLLGPTPRSKWPPQPIHTVLLKNFCLSVSLTDFKLKLWLVSSRHLASFNRSCRFLSFTGLKIQHGCHEGWNIYIDISLMEDFHNKSHWEVWLYPLMDDFTIKVAENSNCVPLMEDFHNKNHLKFQLWVQIEDFQNKSPLKVQLCLIMDDFHTKSYSKVQLWVLMEGFHNKSNWKVQLYPLTEDFQNKSHCKLKTVSPNERFSK